MKSSIYLSILFTCVTLFSSCKKKEEVWSDENFIGSWEEFDCFECDTITFYNNGKYHSTLNNTNHNYQRIAEDKLKITLYNTHSSEKTYAFSSSLDTLEIEFYYEKINSAADDLSLKRVK